MDEAINFVAGDLHVHTPSSNCYKGTKEKKEYLDIIERYYEKNIKIIAITDHNTISGYKELIAIIKELETRRKFLEEYMQAHPDLGEELIKVEQILKMIKQMVIIPGVEFEANPGIHLLFIFSPDTDLIEIEKMLEKFGYTESERGVENPSVVKCDVLDALDAAKSLKAITIAAHVDSTKGIYNSLEAGNYRARVFSSDNLDGISFNNAVTLEKIKGLLGQAEYKRLRPLAMIQSSDHHMASDCGRLLSYYKMEKMDFESLVKCIENPNELISATAKPEIISIIKKIAFDPTCYAKETFDQDTYNKAFCALLNNNYGDILIGVTEDKYKTLKGTDLMNEDIEAFHNELCEKNDKIRLYSSYKVKIYPFSGKNIIRIKVENISKLKFFLGDKYYIFENGRISENNIKDAILHVERKQIENADLFHERIDENIEQIHQQISLLLSTKLNYRTVNIVEEEAIRLSALGKVELVSKNYNKSVDKEITHGIIDGNAYFAEINPQREQEVYLRVTCPATNIEGIEEFGKKFEGSAMIIAPKGVTHFIDKDEWILINNNESLPVLVFSINETFKDFIDIKTMVAWTKSSLSLYYLYCKTGSSDLYMPNTYNTNYVPTRIFDEDIKNEIAKNVDEIIYKEIEFLSREKELFRSGNTKDKKEIIKKLSFEHNASVDINANRIDKVIYESLKINTKTIEAIEQFLEYSGMHRVSIVKET